MMQIGYFPMIFLPSARVHEYEDKFAAMDNVLCVGRSESFDPEFDYMDEENDKNLHVRAAGWGDLFALQLAADCRENNLLLQWLIKYHKNIQINGLYLVISKNNWGVIRNCFTSFKKFPVKNFYHKFVWSYWGHNSAIWLIKSKNQIFVTLA